METESECHTHVHVGRERIGDRGGEEEKKSKRDRGKGEEQEEKRRDIILNRDLHNTIHFVADGTDFGCAVLSETEPMSDHFTTYHICIRLNTCRYWFAFLGHNTVHPRNCTMSVWVYI